jgi:predicted nucleic acid-binding protein
MEGTDIFLDTNITVYLLEKDPARRDLVASFILDERYVVSTQVISENVNVCVRKLRMTKQEAFAHGRFLMDTFRMTYITDSTIALAFQISERYGFGYYDSLIVATAIEHGCGILYSEDMQDGQVIFDKLKVINPFAERGI